MKNILTGLLGSAALIATTTPLHAEQQDAIIVTATRTAQTADESLASVTVLTEADIQRSQANSLQDLLSGYAGMNFVNNGGVGKATSLHMRGTNSNHVIILIDGIKIGSATNGNLPIQDISISQIERIEIVRGPRSSLYGSEAIGGVIQIFTKKGGRKGTANISIGTGSYETNTATAGIAGGNDKTAYQIQASHFETAGFNAQDDKNPDDDGYTNDSLNINFNHKFSNSAEWSINLLHNEGNNEYDGFSKTKTYESDFFQQTIGTSLKLKPTSNWQTVLTLGQNRDESDNLTENVLNSRFDTKRKQALWQNDLNFGQNNLFTVGVDFTKEEIDSSTVFTTEDRENTGIFLQHQWLGQDNDLLYGLRQDNNQAFGKHETGNIAWGHKLSGNMRLILSYGSAFKAPSFNDLYFPGPYGAGNPNLKPEESETYEAILRGQQWEISAYHTKIKNLIVWQETSTFFYEPFNVDDASIQGIDISGKHLMANWQHSLDISLIDPRNDKTDKILPRRSRKSIRLSTDRINNDFQYGAELIGYGERYDDADNKNRMSGYWLMNLHSSYQLNKSWAVKAKLENAMDQDYETAKGYNQAGLSVFASINYQGF